MFIARLFTLRVHRSLGRRNGDGPGGHNRKLWPGPPPRAVSARSKIAATGAGRSRAAAPCVGPFPAGNPTQRSWDGRSRPVACRPCAPRHAGERGHTQNHRWPICARDSAALAAFVTSLPSTAHAFMNAPASDSRGSCRRSTVASFRMSAVQSVALFRTVAAADLPRAHRPQAGGRVRRGTAQPAACLAVSP